MRRTGRFAIALASVGVVLVLGGLLAFLLNAVVFGLAFILVGWFAAMSVEIGERPRGHEPAPPGFGMSGRFRRVRGTGGRRAGRSALAATTVSWSVVEMASATLGRGPVPNGRA
jgi:hypothetical protein